VNETIDLLAPRTVHIERRFVASPDRVYRSLTKPEELTRWFPERVEGSIAAGARSVLVFPDSRVWWDVSVLETDRRLEFHWPWGRDDAYTTLVRIRLDPAGSGTRLTLEDGPFDLRQPGIFEAFVTATEGWSEALSFLRAWVDFSVEIRGRRY
jgi:uncharacterized protein YndB with AHSA1/START domain